ncbi:MAG: FkbM family methyltransferase [Aliishimia sp.]
MPGTSSGQLMMIAPTPIDAKDARRKKRRREARLRAQGILQGVVSMLRPGDVVFDCGANVGEVTAMLAATGATVHAFEPDPLAFARLQDRVGGMLNVHLHAACVGTQNGTVKLARADNFAADPESRTTRSSIIAGGTGMNDDDTFDVPMVDLIALLKICIASQSEVAFVKMDIEGAELDLLEAMHTHALFDDIRLTVAETHQGKFSELRPRFKALRKTFAATYPKTKVFLDWI